jgi:4-hydroxyproline epimerase
VEVEVPGYGEIFGDIAWGGNWFFLIEAGDLVEVTCSNLETLTRFCSAVRTALQENGITGDDGGEIDHIEVFGPPTDPELADSKNFVLCPGKAYDRSPCGTGTSAKLACLAEDRVIQPGDTWRQAGILDSVFEGSYEPNPEGGVIPTISGRAYITGESKLILHPDDPFCHGISGG